MRDGSQKTLLWQAIDTSTPRGILAVLDSRSNDVGDWFVERTDRKTVPNLAGLFVVPAYHIASPGTAIECYLDLVMPERISEHAYFSAIDGVTRVATHLLAGDVIPAVGIEIYGNYELFLSRHDPEIGISVLRRALDESEDKFYPAADLGYVLRDLGRNHEAIEAFTIAIDLDPEAEYLQREREELIESSGETLDTD